MSKNTLVIERIAALEKIFKKSGNQLGVAAGIGNGTVGGWTDNLIGKPSLAVEKFLRYYDIQEQWWKSGKGDVFITPVQNEPAVTEKPLTMDNDIYKEMFEKFVGTNSEYLVIHKDLLKQHRIVALEQFEKDKKQMEKDAKELDERLKQIETLTDIIKEITARPINIHFTGAEKAQENRAS